MLPRITKSFIRFVRNGPSSCLTCLYFSKNVFSFKVVTDTRPLINHFSTSSEVTSVIEEHVKKKSGFVKAYEKFLQTENLEESNSKDQSFTSLLKASKFVDLGDPGGKVITGTVFQVIEDDLYVDFGWKFHCVVPRPLKNGHEYVRGAKVRLSLKDLELSSRFLGSEKDLTLLEADAVLIGLISSPARTGSFR